MFCKRKLYPKMQYRSYVLDLQIYWPHTKKCFTDRVRKGDGKSSQGDASAKYDQSECLHYVPSCNRPSTTSQSQWYNYLEGDLFNWLIHFLEPKRNGTWYKLKSWSIEFLHVSFWLAASRFPFVTENGEGQLHKSPHHIPPGIWYNYIIYSIYHLRKSWYMAYILWHSNLYVDCNVSFPRLVTHWNESLKEKEDMASDMKFVKKFTWPDFSAKNFTH